jgi:hypothetical protein
MSDWLIQISSKNVVAAMISSLMRKVLVNGITLASIKLLASLVSQMSLASSTNTSLVGNGRLPEGIEGISGVKDDGIDGFVIIQKRGSSCRAVPTGIFTHLRLHHAEKRIGMSRHKF